MLKALSIHQNKYLTSIMFSETKIQTLQIVGQQDNKLRGGKRGSFQISFSRFLLQKY